MTTDRKNAISDLTTDQLAAIIAHGYAMNEKLHKITPRAFRSIVGEIGHRDRPRIVRGKPTGHWCDDTLEQLASRTAYSYGGVCDVIALATTVGVIRTVRRGGFNTATKRTIDLDAMLALLCDLCSKYPHLANEPWCGIWRPKRGIEVPKRGADSETPIQIQDIYQDCGTTTAPDDGAGGVSRLESEPPLTREEIEMAANKITNPQMRATFISAALKHQQPRE